MSRQLPGCIANAALYMPVLLWMAVIFYLSSMPGSGVEYEMPTLLLLERKGAHIFEYFLLTLLSARIFVFHMPRNIARSLWLSASFALMYAASDEIHQLFVFGRTGKATDVLIDGIGILFATVFAWFTFIRKNR